MDILEGLNGPQKEAVTTTDGPLLIIAGAGSGKTRVLTHRIAYLINVKKVSPYNILAITFTNKAASEMKDRVEKLLNASVKNMWISTFHSACVRILRDGAERLGYKRSFVIYDTSDSISLIRSCLKELNLDPKYYEPKGLLHTISRAKDSLMDPDTFEKETANDFRSKNVASIYREYQRRLKQLNAMDFDDLIMKTVELFKVHEDFLLQYQNMFRYILVDEYQDTNRAQYELIKILSKRYNNICVVGDDDQSIYGFRGADIRNILDFERDFPNAKVIKLEQNYRSTQKILNAANNLIAHNKGRKGKKLWTEYEGGPDIVLYKAEDERMEARYVVSSIIDLINRGYSSSDIVILYRTNAQSRAFEEELAQYQIGYRVVGSLRFYERKEIKDIMSYLRVIQDPSDEVSLLRIINEPSRGIGEKTIEQLTEYARSNGISLYEAAKFAGDTDLSARQVKGVLSFVNIMDQLISFKDDVSISALVELVLQKTGYLEILKSENTPESESRIENLNEFIGAAKEFEKDNPDLVLEDFLANLALVSDIDSLEDGEGVVMMTVHSAKGLEFPVVFMVGMEDGLFPISRALDNDEDMEEERRLCYVAVTRAKERLIMTYARTRNLYGRTMVCIPSRFIKEIDIPDFAKEPFKKRSMSVEEPGKVASSKEKYAVGMKVMHKMWGSGIIVQVKDMGSDKELAIVFQSVGLKRLSANIAPLKVEEG
ncbi:DNA helicase PcrA [Calorimonas adulescens]|uniref:ATP-dependent DNA helicase n=1 Tax=Calorimonas adulescens TaxID=2606906 RepID=A0A5D8QEM5_9THEO|nr:DNA helicase PcrA [Calorimonas adulescens]TZE81698.1 DNA helicase PcrA [Calorimonas adulescens]